MHRRVAGPAARRGALSLVFTLCGAGATADAQEGHVTVTNTTVGEVRIDNENATPDDDEYGVVLDRLNVSGGAGDLTAGARVDAAGFLLPPTEAYVNQVRLERVHLGYRVGNVSVEIGDYYQQLGRGIALSVRKLDEAGLDISIFGANARYAGEHHALTVFGGRANPANLDAISQRFVEDQRDLLAGGVYELLTGRGVRVGTYGLYTQPEETLLPDTPDLGLTGGAYLDLSGLFNWLTTYLEVAAQERYLGGQPQHGSAAYLQSEIRIADFAVFGEALLLNEFEQKGSRNTALGSRFDYNRPPTLERIDQEVVNNRDIIGTRGRVEYYFFDWSTLVYANLMYRVNEALEPSELHQLHGFVGADVSYDGGASRVSGATGYRHEQQPGQKEPVKTILHFDGDWLHALGGGFALHASTQTWWRTLTGRRYLFGSSFFGVEKAGLGGVTLELGYDTFDPRPGVRNIFYAAIGSWEINDQLLVRATVGTQRGGIKCVAGVCREFPAFAGARGVLISRF